MISMIALILMLWILYNTGKYIYRVVIIEQYIMNMINHDITPELRDILLSLNLSFKYSGALASVYSANPTGQFETLKINALCFALFGNREQLFTLCHEALHIKLNHYKYFKCLNINVNKINIACDIVINQLLVDKYGFSKKECKYFVNVNNTYSFWRRNKINKVKLSEVKLNEVRLNEVKLSIGKSPKYYYRFL